jgi:uncharacterized membrane protein
MAVRLSELHPSLVHYPITLLPLAIGADTAGVLTRDRELLRVGTWCITAAAVSAGVAGLAGLIAQEEVNADPEAMKIMQTHRTLNIAALAVMTGLAVARSRRSRPGLGYLLTGFATVAAVGVSAYLGGKLVYDHGVGVKKAGGIYGEDPSLGDVRRAVRTAANDLRAGIVHTAKEMAKGDIVPVLGEHRGR